MDDDISDIVLHVDVDGDGEPDLSITFDRKLWTVIVGGATTLAAVVGSLVL